MKGKGANASPVTATPSRVRHPVVAVRRRQVLPRWVRRMDVAVGRRINARHAHPLVDRGFARLTHSADRSRLWFSLVALMLLFGRRRPALRGSGSLLVASILANLVGKKLFGGDRPLLKDIPFSRRLKRYPTTPSFPSGHSASAAGFATGVALESRRLGGVIAPVAAAVAYSRLHVGAHWFSDVIGGTAIGVAVAGLGKLLVPARVRAHAPVREGGAEVELPALPDGEGAFIVVNPSSGVRLIGSAPTDRISERLPRAVQHQLDESDDLATIVRAAVSAEPRPRVLGVCGGDGTVASVAHLAREAGLPLLVIPGGTFNHFARAAGVESVDAAIDALQRGAGLRTDVAELAVGDDDPITVLNTASVGVYPEFVAEREKYESGLGKWLAALVAAVRVIRAADPVDVTVDGRPIRVWSLYVGVNVNFPSTVAPLQRRRLDDGLLDVRILHAAGARARAILSLAFGRRTSAVLRRVLPGATAIERFTSETVTVVVRPTRGQPPGLAHDGEVWVDPPDRHAPPGGYVSRIRLVPQALEVYSPAVP